MNVIMAVPPCSAQSFEYEISICTKPCFREIGSHEQADVTANFATDTYTPAASTPPMTGQIPVRVHLVEDRVIPIERKFFCDRATEKTVTLKVNIEQKEEHKDDLQ